MVEPRASNVFLKVCVIVF